MKFLQALFAKLRRPSVTRTTAQLIMETRFYRKLSQFMWLMVILSNAAVYLQFVYPVFLASDVYNPAVIEFLHSRTYAQYVRPNFDYLDEYNDSGDRQMLKLPNNFGVVDPSQWGLVVRVSYRLEPSPIAVAAGRGLRYKFASDFSVKLSIPNLLLFLLLEAGLLAGFLFVFFYKRPAAQILFEEEELKKFFLGDAELPSMAAELRDRLQTVGTVLANFHSFVLQMNRSRSGRASVDVRNEFDVQDILYALLRLHFSDIRDEEFVRSHAGANSRMDFLLFDDEIGIEVKMARETLKDGKLGDELIVDINHYAQHEGCKYLICFVYDPLHLVKNPAALKKGIERDVGPLKVRMVISPGV